MVVQKLWRIEELVTEFKEDVTPALKNRLAEVKEHPDVCSTQRL